MRQEFGVSSWRVYKSEHQLQQGHRILSNVVVFMLYLAVFFKIVYLLKELGFFKNGIVYRDL